MWIMTQDKSQVVEVIKVYILGLDGKNQKNYIIWGETVKTDSIFSSAPPIALGKYKSKEAVICEMESISQAISNNCNLYNMRNDHEYI